MGDDEEESSEGSERRIEEKRGELASIAEKYIGDEVQITEGELNDEDNVEKGEQFGYMK